MAKDNSLIKYVGVDIKKLSNSLLEHLFQDHFEDLLYAESGNVYLDGEGNR